MALSSIIVLCSSFLLFHLQLQLAKSVLPMFGGGPSVWTACSCLFQILLLLGYIYAYLVTQYCNPRRQVAIHASLLLFSLFWLPVSVPQSQPLGEYPAIQLTLLLISVVGLPFLLLASTSTLIQHWWFRENSGKSPYVLFAVSNFGSFMALGAYPLVIEPEFSLRQQCMLASILYCAFCITIGRRAFTIWRIPTHLPAQPGNSGSHNTAESDTNSLTKVQPPRGIDRVLWFFLPFSTSVFLLSVTNHLTIDIAPVPLLWVAPLAVFLLTYVFAFAGAQWYIREVHGVAMGLCSVLFLWLLSSGSSVTPLAQIAGMLVVLAVFCHVCHGELALSRPHGSFLNQFNLLIALGGSAGAFCCTFLFPLVFTEYWELQLGFLACLIGASAAWLRSRWWLSVRVDRLLVPLVYTVHVIVLASVLDAFGQSGDDDRNALLFLYSIVLLCLVHLCSLANGSEAVPFRRIFLLAVLQLLGMTACLVGVMPDTVSPLFATFAVVLSAGSALLCITLQRVAHVPGFSQVAVAVAGAVVFAFRDAISVATLQPASAIILLSGAFAGSSVVEFIRRRCASKGNAAGNGAARLWIVTVTFVVAAAICLREGTQRSAGSGIVVHQSRSFFGVISVMDFIAAAGTSDARMLKHGRIVHGVQLLGAEKSRIPTSYYASDSGVAQAIATVRERRNSSGESGLRIGVVGLGAGTLAAYGETGDTIRFYEINPVVVNVAQSTFRFISESAAECEFAIGDARRVMQDELTDEGGRGFDVLAVDAFTSDAIPVHLLTVECARIFEAHLAEGGVLAYHISNRYLDLSPVIYAIAKSLDSSHVRIQSSDPAHVGGFASTWVLVFRDQSLAEPLGSPTPSTESASGSTSVIRWTDDHSSVWEILTF